MDRRQAIKALGSLTVAGAVHQALAGVGAIGRAVGSVGSGVAQTFDYYISPTGSDSNTGSLASPWAMTSLSLVTINANNVANCKAMAGKRVGCLPGTYYLTCSFTGSITSGSNSMTVSGLSSVLTQGMGLISGFGSAYTAQSGNYNYGCVIGSVSGNTITLVDAAGNPANAAATLTNATIVATFMKMGGGVTGAFQLVGGTSGSPTYIASSGSSGYYLAPNAASGSGKTCGAIFDAEGGSGVPAGYSSQTVGEEMDAIFGHYGFFPSTYAVGNLTIDAIGFTGFSYYALGIGGYPFGDGPANVAGITIQNCEIWGGSCIGMITDNIQAIYLGCTTDALVTNNWIHDNQGHTSGSSDHLAAIICWGGPTGSNEYCTGTLIENNTVVNSGSIFGKNIYIQGTEVRYNFLDTSALVAGSGIEDFTGGLGAQTGTTSFHHNVIVFNSSSQGTPLFGGATLAQSYSHGFAGPVEVYNNTVSISTGGFVSAPNLISTDSGGASYYNNIIDNTSTTAGADNTGWGTFAVNASAVGVWDYNLLNSPTASYAWNLYVNISGESYGTADGTVGPFTHTAAVTPVVYGGVTVTCGTITATDNGSGTLSGTGVASGTINYSTGAISITFSSAPTSGTAITVSYLGTNGSYTTATTFASALATAGGISGAEAHSIIGTAPTFANTGKYAALYKLATGSAGVGTGSTNGQTSGSACDMGAWGGASPPSSIGCNFAS